MNRNENYDIKKEQNIEVLFNKINTVFNDLSPAQQKAAIYIKKNWEKICLMTAKEVGYKAEVSEATIQRISKCLGYKSFRNLKEKMKKNLLKNRAIVQFELKKSSNETSWLQNHINTELSNIDQTFRLNTNVTFENAAKLIISSKRICVIGEKMGSGASSYISFGLNYLLGNTTYLNLSNCYEHLAYMNENDVFIVLGFQRYCKNTLNVISLAKEKGVKIISFTDCDLSPFAKLSDVSFYSQTSSIIFLDSYSCVLSLVQALFAKIIENNREAIGDNIKNIEDVYNSM